MEQVLDWVHKICNPLSVVGGFLGILVNRILGEVDNSLIILLILMSMDMICGILVEGIYFKKLSSRICWKGLIKKCVSIMLVGLSYQIDRMTGQESFRAFTIIFFSINESISILEICGKIIPIPKKLKNCLYQLRKGVEEDEKNTCK